MSLEGYANDYQTTLAGTIADDATSLTLSDATGAPDAPFRLRIGDELIGVGARAGTACSVLTRGAEGTTAVGHTDGATITHVLTAASLRRLGTVVHRRGLRSAQPDADDVDEGTLYCVTDESSIVERSTGAAWETYSPAAVPGGSGAELLAGTITTPVLGDFSWINQSTAVATDHTTAITLSMATGDGGENIHLLYVAAPGTPYTVQATLIPQIILNTTTPSLGVMWRESATEKLVGLAFRSDSVFNLYGWTNPTTYGGYNPYSAGAAPWWNRPVILYLQDTGAVLKFGVGNGFAPISWLASTARNAFFTTAPDQVGWFINPYAGASSLAATLISWAVSA